MGDLAKAKLQELNAGMKPLDGGHSVEAQFNPESLKVTFVNRIVKGGGVTDQNGPQAMQAVGSGDTKLAAQLWFDVTQETPSGAVDVRRLTTEVAYFITPQEKQSRFLVPLVRFEWGTFQFDGVMEAMDETLELFSTNGTPLRASVSITIAQQKIKAFAFAAAGGAPRGAQPAAGTRAGVSAPEGASLQSMAAGQPGGGDWQSVAAANGIENPRRLQPGQRVEFGT